MKPKMKTVPEEAPIGAIPIAENGPDLHRRFWLVRKGGTLIVKWESWIDFQQSSFWLARDSYWFFSNYCLAYGYAMRMRKLWRSGRYWVFKNYWHARACAQKLEKRTQK